VRERRIGLGWDVHALAEGGDLTLGGVDLEHERGSGGSDVLLHALADAVLGAAGQGDVGERFPDDAPCAELLRDAVRLVEENGWSIVNADCTVVIREPRLTPYKDRIRGVVGGILGVTPDRVNVKAKTGEGVGPVGRGEAVEARAAVLVERS
jgi:2-C-methyl-D-erythritol 2,4-cyclodiphosphate synthase